MNAATMTETVPSLNSDEIQLKDATPGNKVIPVLPDQPAYPRYNQRIEYNGSRLILQTPPMLMDGLECRPSCVGGYSLLIPISLWTRQQFDIIEEYIRKTVKVPSDLLQMWPDKRLDYYKSLYRGNNMYINLGRFYKVTKAKTLSIVESVPSQPLPDFGKGLYSFQIEIPQVYIGPHKDGHLFSINMRIVRMHFQECDSINSIVENCFGDCKDVSNPVDAKFVTVKRRRVKRNEKSD